MRHVVQVSSGVGSAYTWRLIVEEHGPENVIGLFADVNGEDPDNYRFLAETHFVIGSRLVKLGNDGQTIWDVFKAKSFLGNSRVGLCSRVLKFEACLAWMQDNCDPADTTLYLGFDCTEEPRYVGYTDRAGRRHPGQQERWEAYGFTVAAPMIERDLDKGHALAWLLEIGIEPPLLTRLGYSHANCMGGCVKAGARQFRRLLHERPLAYAWWETHEEEARAALGDFAILRDRRGGKTKPLPLSVLRESERLKPGLFDHDDRDTCGCY